MWWTVCAILSLPLLAHPGRANSPYFVATPQNVSAAIGRDAHLNCSVMGAGDYKVAWIGMTRGTVLSLHDEKVYDHPRVEIRHSTSSAGLNSFILTIKDVTHEDKGNFLCQVNTVQGLKRIYTLSIVVPPSIKDASSSGDMELSEGESVVLTCRAEGKPEPTITWRREDSSLIRYGDYKAQPSEGEKLILSKVDRTNAGAYLCIASNGIPPSVSKRIQLNVRFQPKIKASIMFVEAQIGGDANLSCIVDAYPKPEMTWLQDVTRTSMRNHLFHHTHEDGRIIERNLIQTSVIRINESQFLMNLLIKDVQPSHFHGYRCHVNNSEGVAEARITLREIITTTQPPTTTASTLATSSQLPTWLVHHLTSPRGNLDWRPGIEASGNRTLRNDYVTTHSPQQLYFSDQHKHNSNSQRRKNQSLQSNSNEDIRSEIGSKPSVFSIAGRTGPSSLVYSIIASSILLIYDSKWPLPCYY